MNAWASACASPSPAASLPIELLSHLGREGLSKYDMPEFFVRLDEFPLTASGKILKRNLVEMVKRGELAPEPIRFQPAEGSR
jgi:acyl-CoA synthetase